uniref:Uncharacterized protein n=1 Tax=viral metagenome TaxID=1070528 RepID=A0A6C0BSS8_9ZZZZ
MDWTNWSYGKNRMVSNLENLIEPQKRTTKWYYHYFYCFCTNKKDHINEQ